MKLRTKIMMIALLPVFILGIGIFILAADRTANGIYDEAYAGMQAASLAVRDIFEVGNHGSYHMDENGDLWKGESLNISEAVEIVDHIKNKTGMDVTIFWNDTRILTSIKNEAGERQIHTKASNAVINKVLKQGEYYLDRNVEILGAEYIVCYAPFYQEMDTNNPVGMVFVGKPRAQVEKIINEIRLQMLIAILVVLFVTAILVTGLVKHIVSALERSMGLLQRISEGDLSIEPDRILLKRSDEIGMLGRGILELRNKLREIVNVLKEKSTQLDLEAGSLRKRAANILQVMKGLDQSAQEMSASCMSQAEDAGAAGNDVTQIGEMIGSNNAEMKRMYEISSQIQNMSEQMMKEMTELNSDMKQVRSSVDYLGQQTGKTKEFVDKISCATELIAAVASQTSLLALNASIEAARAGEFGRGFGVVASEIQSLSVQANDSVQDIQNMIKDLTENSGSMTQRMEETQKMIQNQEKTIQKTGEVFENVKEEIKESVMHMDVMLEKSEEMEHVRTDMVAVVQNSAALSQENAANVEEMMRAINGVYEELQKLSGKTEELSEVSEEMKESVGVFK